MAVTYTDLDDKALLQVADILSKKEAINAELERIQNRRAKAEVRWARKEEALKAEQNALVGAVRQMRTASIVDEEVVEPKFAKKV